MEQVRSALLTGAAAGIGRATALAFARAGYRVVVADLAAAEGGGNDTVAAIRAGGGEAFFVAADVSRASDVAALIQAAARRPAHRRAAEAGIEPPPLDRELEAVDDLRGFGEEDVLGSQIVVRIHDPALGGASAEDLSVLVG